MKLNEYQSEALTTRLPSATSEYLLMNYAAEAGELLGLKAKAIRDGRLLDHDQQVKKELGDGLWHIAAIAADHGFTLEEVAQGNLNKLASRKERGALNGSGDDR